MKAILSVLARRADDAGQCEITQGNIAKEIEADERTVRRSLPVLETLGVISRSRKQNYQKRGRSADVVALAIDQDFTLTKECIMDARHSGPTGQNVLKTDVYLPDKLAGAPTNENATSLYKARARSVEIETSRLKSSLPCTTRVRFDRGRGKWRASITVDSETMDLGRFDTEAEAMDFAANAKADVARTSIATAGTPRNPVVKPEVAALDVPSLGAFLFGDDPFPEQSQKAVEEYPEFSQQPFPPQYGYGAGEASAMGQGAKLLAGVGGAHEESSEYDAARACEMETMQ
ncbi:helix-turn-helix domain-containing protein [Rhizobium mongolense]|uniref:Uncharacterized protein n=1 Tax=Rhizobium mongolense TaxID=57676 RepID=A0A7W6WCA5_9HYPH|nr:helix-turn-helix domain-containing protein [Rhizobium mongolense]MBB4272329.1 hypothetical protein [Rhizobium mongolense]